MIRNVCLTHDEVACPAMVSKKVSNDTQYTPTCIAFLGRLGYVAFLRDMHQEQ